MKKYFHYAENIFPLFFAILKFGIISVAMKEVIRI